MKVLLTGGTGFIGSHASIVLLQAGHDVTIYDNLSRSTISVLKQIFLITNRKPDFIEGDIRNTDLLTKVFNNFEFDAVVHFAGLKSPQESILEPLKYYDNNVSGSLSLLKAMAKSSLRKIIFSSSASVYGDSCSFPLREDSVLEMPRNPYAQSKFMVEQVLGQLCNSDSLWSALCLRYFNPVGAHATGRIGERFDPNSSNLATVVARVAMRRLPTLKIYGSDYPTVDGTGVRDFIHVMDVAEGHNSALRYVGSNSGFRIINLGTGRPYSVKEFVKTYETENGIQVPFEIVNRREGDIAESWASVSLAKKMLDWESNYSLSEMCRDSWRWQQTLYSDDKV